MALPESGHYHRHVLDLCFTIICEFRGGTYASQVRAQDEQHALTAWADVLRRDQPMGVEAEAIAKAAIEEAEPLNMLDGLNGVWCWTANVEGHFVLTNIVKSG